MNLTAQELNFLIAGLDLLARQQKDVLSAASELIPLRLKLNAEAEKLKQPPPEEPKAE